MFAQYLRVIFVILALIAGVLLFAFAFTTAAIVVGVLLLIGLVFGGRRGGNVWVFRREAQRWPSDDARDGPFPPRGPLTIDHDPNDLPATEVPPNEMPSNDRPPNNGPSR